MSETVLSESTAPARTPSASPTALGGLAITAVVVLCASWGLQQVAVKAALPEVPPLLQSAIRTAIAAALVAGWVILRGRPLFARDGSLWPGLLAGGLFGAEFICINLGLQWTSASRAVLFIYTAPFFVALGSIWLLPEERLAPHQWLGLAFSFIGVAIAMGLPAGTGSPYAFLGDMIILLAGLLWATTTLTIKSSRLKRTTPEKVLLYQLVVCAILSGAGALIAGERIVTIGPIGFWSLAYQTVWVAAITYVVWFGLVARYPAGQLSVFTFLTPLCGIAAGAVILSEPLSPAFLLAAALVAAGLVLVNRPRRRS